MSGKAELILPAIRTQVQMRFSDTDAMGHVSSMSYGNWTEVARAEYFQAIPEPALEIPWFVMVHTALDFHKEGRFGQSFVIHTRCTEIGQKSMTLLHEIDADGVRVCTQKVVLAAFDQQSRRAIPVPTHWRATAG